jgi:hypothetical protein
MAELSPQDFVAKWRKAQLKERSAAQEHKTSWSSYYHSAHEMKGAQL